MEEEVSSWIRRTKFSHTVCHRLNSIGLASLPLSIDEDRISRLGPFPGRGPCSSSQTVKNSASVASQVWKSPDRSSTKKSASFASHDQKSPVHSSMNKSASFASIPFAIDEESILRFGGLFPGRYSSSNQTVKNSAFVAGQVQNSPVRDSASVVNRVQNSPVRDSTNKSASFASQDQKSPARSSTKKSASFASQVQNSPVCTSTKKSASFAGHDQKSPVRSQIQRIMNKQRSMSPLRTTELSDTFREARSERKRFSTPLKGRVLSRDTSPLKLFSRDTSPFKGKLFDRDTSPLKHLTSWKGREKSKIKKECSWIKYFDNGGGKINAVGAADEFTVDMSQLFLGLRFAHGAHSRLYHGVYKDEPIAVKMIRVPDDDESGTLAVRLGNQYEREVTLLSRLHHPNVIKFVAACRKPPVYCIITEYLSEGSLRAYLHKLEHKALPLQKLIAIALDIARGVEYIHSEGVIHRDLKPENILINKDFQMKLADFGIACEEAYCDSLADDPGTYRWMAPEMIKKKPYGRKVDVYSFGLILWEMVAGTIPYEDMNPIQAAFAVVNKNIRPVVPVTCPPAMKALIEQCWSLQSEKRPEFWQIVMVLEQFESSLASDGTLNLVQNPLCQDHKKGLLHWIQKLTPAHPTSPTPKPKFA